jgi:hypothetical protein
VATILEGAIVLATAILLFVIGNSGHLTPPVDKKEEEDDDDDLMLCISAVLLISCLILFNTFALPV